ncbi:MAG: aspartate aminotransferase family protein [Rhodobiaceae bacterium]|nr:aspartate aminotransferase family protein [Rhodobiaceae bacterium]
MTRFNQKPTAELQALDASHHFHPFSHMESLNAEGSRVIVRAKGIWLEDSEGKRILDGMSGLWCVNVGYGRDEIVEAVERQMRELPYYNTFFKSTHLPAIELSSKLAEITPDHINTVFFCGSGSEANDTVIRMVRHYWAAVGEPDRQIIISRKNAYHGSTIGGTSLGGMSAMHGQGGVLPGIHHIDQPYWFGEGDGMDPAEFGLARARALETAIEEIGPDKVAAFIGEPIQGAGGVVIPPATYWPEIQRICDKYGILLIADEVICGFGRLGEWFGSDHFGIRPDLMPMAKGMSSGYLPIGGVGLSDRVAEVLGAHGEFFHGYTYSGHPACCAAAVANIAILEEENVLDHVRTVAAPRLKQKWLALGDHPLVGEARMEGLVGALELVPAKGTPKRFEDKGTVGTICRDISFGNGLVMRAVGDAMIIAPPLVITPDEIDQLAALAKKTLDDTYAKLKADGLV